MKKKKNHSLAEYSPETAKAGSVWYFASIGYSHFPVERSSDAPLPLTLNKPSSI